MTSFKSFQRIYCGKIELIGVGYILLRPVCKSTSQIRARLTPRLCRFSLSLLLSSTQGISILALKQIPINFQAFYNAGKPRTFSIHKYIFPFIYKIQPFVIKIKVRIPELREGLYTISPFKFLRS